MSDPAIEVRNVSLRFPRTQFRARGIKEAILQRGSGRLKGQDADFWAVKKVSFNVEQGEVIGLIGANGSGKSTLLKVISGIYRPDGGELITRGRISALLELGAGFREELTGFENIRLNGAILGFSPDEMDRRSDQIIEFSGLSEFIHQPLRTYSSGMKVRLAFAIAASIEPEILLIDEVLAVGDEDFGRKSLARIEQLASGHVTVVIVSHNLQIMQRLCDRLILMSHGEVLAQGNPEAVVNAYYRLIGVSKIEGSVEGALLATKMEILDAGGAPATGLIAGRPAILAIDLEVKKPVPDSVVLTFTLSLSEILATQALSAPLGPLREGEKVSIRYRIESLDLVKNHYQLTAGVRSADETKLYEIKAAPVVFKVEDSPQEAGVHALWVSKGRWEINKT